VQHDGRLSLREFTLRVLVVAGIAALAAFLWRISDVLLLAFGGGLVALLLHEIAEPFRRIARLGDTAALAVAVLLLATLLGAAGWLFGHELGAQFGEVLRRLPRAWESLREFLGRFELGRTVLAGMQDSAAGIGLFTSKLPGAAAAVTEGLLNVLVVAFGGIYLALTPGVYRKGLLALFPASARNGVGDIVDTACRALRLWLKGQLITMTIVGVLTAAGLWAAGVPAPLALGLLAAVLEFIPYIGPIVAAVPGLLLALSAGPVTVAYALVVYVAVQQLEGNIVQPMVQRGVLRLPPALVIFSVVALGLTFGTLGWVFAAPLTVLLVVVVGKAYVREALGTPARVPGEGKPAPR
jgi:predicted PurR-regulated permease PerM